MLHTNYQGRRSIGSKEEDLISFFYIQNMGIAAILVR